jgi:hypothetical protein
LVDIALPTEGTKSELPRFIYHSFLTGTKNFLPPIFDSLEALFPCSKFRSLSQALFKHLNNEMMEIAFSETGLEADVEFTIKLFADFGEKIC